MEDPGDSSLSWMYDVALEDMRTRVVPAIDDSFVSRRAKGVARLVKYLREEDRFGPAVAEAQRHDLSGLLGVDVEDVAAARRTLCERIRDGEIADAPVVVYALRDWARRTQVLRPAMGSLADRRYAPLPPAPPDRSIPEPETSRCFQPSSRRRTSYDPGMATAADLKGKVAVVTGGGSGLGAAMGRVLAEAGMAVAALDIDEANARATAAALTEELGVRTLGVKADVGDAASVAAAAATVEAELGGCDVLCANVGVQQFGAIDRLTDDDWSWVMNVNVLGTVRTVAAFLPLLRRSEGLRQIVLTSSSSALVPGIRLGAYVTSKYAVLGYGETLRMELADEGIGVTLVLPAGMMTRHLESSALGQADREGRVDPSAR